MKKASSLIFGILLCLFLSACRCSHEWQDATCLDPQVCSLCEEIQGEPLGHHWMNATCETAKTCAACGLTDGETLGHNWEDATCETAKTCAVCARTEGAPLGHSFGVYTCDGTNFISNCALCDLEQVLNPETYARQLLVGTWEAEYYFDPPAFTEDPGHTVTFYADGTGTLDLDKRLWYPETVRLRFEGFAHQDEMGSFSMDFHLDGYMLDTWDAQEYETISQMGYGIRFRLHTPDSDRDWDVFIAMSYPGYSATWDFRKKPAD